MPLKFILVFPLPHKEYPKKSCIQIVSWPPSQYHHPLLSSCHTQVLHHHLFANPCTQKPIFIKVWLRRSMSSMIPNICLPSIVETHASANPMPQKMYERRFNALDTILVVLPLVWLKMRDSRRSRKHLIATRWSSDPSIHFSFLSNPRFRGFQGEGGKCWVRCRKMTNLCRKMSQEMTPPNRTTTNFTLLELEIQEMIFSTSEEKLAINLQMLVEW